jgi:hypothetical protein
MIEINQDIRIYDDTGRGKSYEINNIIYSDDNIIVATIVHPDFDEIVYLTINRHTKFVISEHFQFYIAENHINKLKQYVINGGELFNVEMIETIRDGGTKVIKTNRNSEFYIHMMNSSIHSSYPPTKENEVNDDNLIEYLLDRVHSYIERCSEQLDCNKKLLIDMDEAVKYKRNLPF